MSAADWIKLMVQASICLIVLGLGMKARGSDILFLLHQPRLLGKSLFTMYVIMPFFVIGFLSLFDLAMPVYIGLGLLALAPVPPILPMKQLKAGGETAYIFALLFATAVTAVALIPLLLGLLGRFFDFSSGGTFVVVTKVLAITVLAPLFIGVLLRHFLPSKAERVSSFVGTLGTVLLVLAIIPGLIRSWPAMMELVGNGTILAMAVTSGVGLLAGHMAGGPIEKNRTTLALAAATRHPGVALTVGAADFPNEPMLVPAVLLYVIVTSIVSIPYMIWRKRGGNLPIPHTPAWRPRSAD